MTRYLYADITDALVGRSISGISHTGENPIETRQMMLEQMELQSSPPVVLAVHHVDNTVRLGCGAELRGPRDDVVGYDREFGVGPDGWIEVVDA